MRKREIEKLLFNAVAEALGVEPTKHQRLTSSTKRSVAAPKRNTASRHEHHRAAA